MKPIAIEYQNSLVSEIDLHNLGDRLKPEIERVAASWGSGYNSEYAFLSLPNDKTLIGNIETIIKEKQKLEPTLPNDALVLAAIRLSLHR